MKFRHAYSTDAARVTRITGLHCEDPTMAQQHFKDECDINYMMKTFQRTGRLPEPVITPKYGDFSECTDFHGYMNIFNTTRETFMELPSDVREKFDNNAANLVEWLNANQDNYQQMVDQGHAVEKEPESTPETKT